MEIKCNMINMHEVLLYKSSKETQERLKKNILPKVVALLCENHFFWWRKFYMFLNMSHEWIVIPHY